MSSPLNYFGSEFNWAVRQEVHAGASLARRALRKLTRENAKAVIIGGGGLIGQPFFDADISSWTRGQIPTILWGAGHNSHDIYAVDKRQPGFEEYGQLRQFNLVGIRDYNAGFTWVPCPSCMNPRLDERGNSSFGTLFLLHRDLRSDKEMISSIVSQSSDDARIVFNDCSSQAFVEAICSARRIVTNSYHAAYLGTLAKKPVVAIGGGSKMLTLKHQVPIAQTGCWTDAFSEAEVHEAALEECRDANRDFCHRVKALIGNQSKASVRRYVPDPIRERMADELASDRAFPAIVKNRVPKIIHFIFGLSPDFGGKPFNVMHKVAVRSAIEKIKPEEVFFHHHYKPESPSFRDVEGLLSMNKIVIPHEFKGRKLNHFAHKADITRMSILKEMGGIYLDLDTITVKPFDDMLDSSFSIGLQIGHKVDGLCNAVMLAAPNDGFLVDWLNSYERFSDKTWDQFSVQLPYVMWRSGFWTINVQPHDRFHWPSWDDQSMKLMFEENHSFDNAVCHHLWESYSYKKYFVHSDEAGLSDWIRNGRSTYSRLASRYI
ncbi:hypothetical protein BST63_07715 [Bradyrhizobium canariense]|uniref:Polysaccharide pyruvyl transferase domain-containing protein n=1 Tax=Bradyrhizobium canariense TaxID=255045 RepID=A0ABX3X8L9_9BRAD|nr:glycosyltransferase [Bradyrhizobium canariense]OSJ09954.1 hypothetical protein BSR47_29580 [Bradyrhizobium canariense]OSJ32473.1 hypothetical protein BST63_07715 [Bradyrhizobium canariense]